MKFDELYKKVIDSCRAFEERQVPIILDFKIEDLRDALVESNDTIEKLKAKLETVNELIKTAQQMLEDAKATHYTEMVDAGMRERRLRRALYKACANWADVVAFEETEGIGHDNSVAERWRKMERKCLNKMEEYR